MRFLIDADLPRPTSVVIEKCGHQAVDVRAIGLGSASDEEIIAHAQAGKLCLLTGDLGFADIRRYPPHDYYGLAVLRLPGNADRDCILHLVEAFLAESEVLARLVGRLAIVEFGRIRLRPA